MKRIFTKKLFIFIVALTTLMSALALVVTLALGANVAFADAEAEMYIKSAVSDLEGNEYAGAGTLSVWEKDGAREFLIPESYYIKITDTAGTSAYEVNYVGQKFFTAIKPALVPSEETFAADEVYYPDVILTLSPDAQLSTLEGVDDQLKKLDATYTVNFLGYAADPETPELIYIMATPLSGKALFGFIPASAFDEFHVPYQQRVQRERDDILAQQARPDTPLEPGDLPAPTGSTALKIILILGISLPAVLIVILLFVPSRRGDGVRKTRGASSDGRDYDDPGVTQKRYRSDRQQYDGARSYGRPYDGYDNYGGQNGAYGDPQGYGDPRGSSGYGDSRGNSGYGDPRGGDPRMNREVRGYDPDDPTDRR